MTLPNNDKGVSKRLNRFETPTSVALHLSGKHLRRFRMHRD